MNQFLSRKWVPFLLIGLVSFLVWGHSLRFDFVYDDRNFIEELESIRSLKNIPSMFYRLEAQASLPHDFKVFRPLRTAHYAILYFLGGKETPQPWLFHLANVAWHAATAMIFYVIAFRLFRLWRTDFTEEETRLWALLVSFGFAIHPVVSEVVCWAKSLDDIMAAFFTLAALNEILKGTERKNYLLGLLYFLLATYSKESAVPFAIIPFFIYRQVHKLTLRHNAMLTFGFLAIGVLHMAHRHIIIGQSSQIAPISGSYGQTLIDMAPVVLKYFRLLWGIPPFYVDYSFMKGNLPIFSGIVIAGFGFLVALISAGIWTWRKESLRLIGFGLLWTGVFLLPVSNLLPMMQYMAERFLYLSLLGWLLAAVGLLSLIPNPRLGILIQSILLLGWAPIAWNRSLIWKDDFTLWIRSSQEAPMTSRIQQNSIAAISALPHIKQFFKFDPKTKTLSVVGAISPGQLAAVGQTFEEAHRMFPNDGNVATALGVCYVTAGKPDKAVPLFEIAVRDMPNVARNWNNLALACMEIKNYPRTREALAKALALAPNDLNTLRNWIHLHWQLEDYAAALEVLKRLDQLEPNGDSKHWIQEAEKKLKAKE